MNQNEKIQLDVQELWHKFKDGHQKSLGHIFQYYFQELYYYGLKIIPSPDLVKDVIQDMFVQFWDKRSRLGEVKNIKAYLLITLRRELIHILKSDRFEQLGEKVKPELFSISIEDLLIQKEGSTELSERVVSSFKKLSPRQREVIFLRFYHNLDFPQLSEVLEMNIQSVRNLLFRALKKIRKDLEGWDLFDTENLEIILFHLFSKKVVLN